MTIINCTPHAISITDGPTFEPSGAIARVTASFVEAEVTFGNLEKLHTVDCDGIKVFEQRFGEIIDLPDPEAGNVYIVSAIVLSALAGKRHDVVAPATGHPACVRNDKGHIISVPGFVV